MRLHKRLVYSLAFAIILFFLSLATTIVPCQTAPTIPSPTYSWTFCTLNPDINYDLQIQKNYLGLTSSLTQAYILVIGLTFILAFIAMSLAFKTKKQ